MFKHEEDGAEVEMKICTDGILVVHCPKCNRLWADTLNVIQVTKGGIGVSGFMIDASDKSGTIRYSGAKEKFINAAKKAFPEVFK